MSSRSTTPSLGVLPLDRSGPGTTLAVPRTPHQYSSLHRTLTLSVPHARRRKRGAPGAAGRRSG
eukprot:1923035-Rhodomonas_salina.4